MIQIESLRRGNILLGYMDSSSKEELLVVQDIEGSEIWGLRLEEERNGQNLHTFLAEDFNRVELTPAVLKAIGYYYDGYLNGEIWKPDYEQVKETTVILTKGNTYFTTIFYPHVELRYLDHFQNLFYSLTNETELNIDPEQLKQAI